MKGLIYSALLFVASSCLSADELPLELNCDGITQGVFHPFLTTAVCYEAKLTCPRDGIGAASIVAPTVVESEFLYSAIGASESGACISGEGIALAPVQELSWSCNKGSDKFQLIIRQISPTKCP